MTIPDYSIKHNSFFLTTVGLLDTFGYPHNLGYPYIHILDSSLIYTSKYHFNLS